MQDEANLARIIASALFGYETRPGMNSTIRLYGRKDRKLRTWTRCQLEREMESILIRRVSGKTNASGIKIGDRVKFSRQFNSLTSRPGDRVRRSKQRGTVIDIGSHGRLLVLLDKTKIPRLFNQSHLIICQ